MPNMACITISEAYQGRPIFPSLPHNDVNRVSQHNFGNIKYMYT